MTADLPPTLRETRAAIQTQFPAGTVTRCRREARAASCRVSVPGARTDVTYIDDGYDVDVGVYVHAAVIRVLATRYRGAWAFTEIPRAAVRFTSPPSGTRAVQDQPQEQR